MVGISYFVGLLCEKLGPAARLHREPRESRTLQLHVALRSEVNAKFRHFGTCSQPTCFIKKLFINSCGPRSVSKMFWGYTGRRKTLSWLGADVWAQQRPSTAGLRVFVPIYDIVLKCYQEWRFPDDALMICVYFFTCEETLGSLFAIADSPDAFLVTGVLWKT